MAVRQKALSPLMRPGGYQDEVRIDRTGERVAGPTCYEPGADSADWLEIAL